MTKKKVAAFFTAAALCGALAVGSSMAYLTDHDSVTNKFSVGKVDIVGHEPNYTPDNDGKTNNIVPTQVIKKDPQIENVGKNDAYVYLDVSIPIAKVITVNAAGNRLNGGVAKDTELFSMNNVSKKWTLMYNKRVGDNMVYTYSYNEILAPGKTTDQNLMDRHQQRTDAIQSGKETVRFPPDSHPAFYTAMQQCRPDLVQPAFI